ncbi:MAG: VOC family protein [Alphaproteobacteria bacterium]|nr:VOC family protein [Alphaproteobacteria bacterium]
MISGLSHITLSVKDLARSLAFYVDVLRCALRAQWPRGAYLSAGDVWLALVVEAVTRDGPLPEYSHIAFRVTPADFDVLAQRIRGAGARIFQDNTTEGESLYFLDPDGHKLEIHVGDLDTRLDAARRAPWPGLKIVD